jgi:chemotaxis-related protein WspD
MSEIPESVVGVVEDDRRCWTETGVWGDRTCVELPRVVHCRNCSMYSAGGRGLLDRPAPDDYIDSWTEALAEDRAAAPTAAVPHLVFRVGDTWLALRAATLREITATTVIRSVPHRPREILLGLVNIRGELFPCLSLHTLFGEQRAESSRTGCFLVARSGSDDWVFPVDQVDGIHDVPGGSIDPLPSTLENVQVVYTSGLFRCNDRTVAIIDEELLFSSLKRRIS